MWEQYLATIAIAWSLIILAVISIGTIQLYRHFSKPIPKSSSSELELSAVPHVTIIRPIVGLEPYLEDCLVSSFTQDYPVSKLTISFCISSADDASYPILQKLLTRFPSHDARIYIETEDPNLRAEDGGRVGNLGPNPKIRNMSRAYREAKGDIIWIADCNVWFHERTAGLMVDLLCGLRNSNDTGSKRKPKYKFVHQLPLAVDVSSLPASKESILVGAKGIQSGSLAEEMFMSTSHVKFYTAISTVAIAPCTVGKSNMFRRSHLNALTQTSQKGDVSYNAGIDFFSENICEDHLIGDLLWKTDVPSSIQILASEEGHSKTKTSIPISKQKWAHHALLLNPPCVQPQFNTTIAIYAARRIRWLRVRKFTVPVATLVEPCTESLVACSMTAWALTTHTWVHRNIHIPQTWTAFAIIFLTTMTSWVLTDRAVWHLMQSWNANAADEKTAPPVFVGAAQKRPWKTWLRGWAGRELLAWPIWAWAVLGGTQVVWRGRKFWVGVDMKVHAVDGDGQEEEDSKKQL